jgi:hypothetical protein
MIKKVSFSRLMDFEKCKYLAKLKYVDKVPEPPRALPQGKSEHANDRGTRVHDAAEQFIRGGVELVPELKACSARYDDLKRLYHAGGVELEGEWAFTEDWESVGWLDDRAWVRMKLDAFVRTGPTSARVIDYKTGRRAGNEVKHTEQGQLYQLGTFMRHPELTDITVEFWYVDIDEFDIKKYTRAQGMAYLEKYQKRLLAMSGCEDFKPNPNVYSCKWCPYRGNVCEHGITAETRNKAPTRYRQPASRYTFS